MREFMKKLPENEQALFREIISCYLDHNPAVRKAPGDLKKHTKGKIEQFTSKLTRNKKT